MRKPCISGSLLGVFGNGKRVKLRAKALGGGGKGMDMAIQKIKLMNSMKWVYLQDNIDIANCMVLLNIVYIIA